MKDVKKLLREQANDILPDDRIKDNIRRELMNPQTESEIVYTNGETRSVHSSKKKILGICTALLLAAALLFGVLLPIFRKGPLNPEITPNGLGKFSAIENTRDFYVYGAASVGSLLTAQPQPTDVPIAKAMSYSAWTELSSPTGSEALTAPPQTQKSITDTLDEYMALVENLLSEGNIEHTDGETTNEQYAQKYKFHMIISYSDLLGNPVNYDLYYNRILNASETDGDEREDCFSIDGILVIGEHTYAVKGEHKQESETDETESELCFTAYINNEKTSYIRLQREQETETDEQELEFQYSFYENGKFVKKTSVQYEQEEGELELNLSIEENGTRDLLTFSRESEQDALEVHGSLQGQPVHCLIRIADSDSQKYEYFFLTGSDKDDDDDDDDDTDSEEKDDSDDDDDTNN